MKRIKYILLFVFLFIGFSANSQFGYTYRQYVLNQMGFNPAYTGSREVFSLASMVRLQWVGITGAPKSQFLTADAPLKKNKVALGMSLLNETMGTSGYTNLEFNYAYRISFEKSKLSLGLKTSLNTYRNDVPVLNDQSDLTFINSDKNYIFPNFGIGAYYYDYNRFFVGLSVPDMLGYYYQSEKNSYKIDYGLDNYGFIFSSGLLMDYGENVKSRVSGMAMYNTISNVDFDMNLMFILMDRFWLGGSFQTIGYRTVMLQVQVNPQLKLGYSYDFNGGNLELLGGGSHEIMLRYEFSYKINALNPRYF